MCSGRGSVFGSRKEKRRSKLRLYRSAGFADLDVAAIVIQTDRGATAAHLAGGVGFAVAALDLHVEVGLHLAAGGAGVELEPGVGGHHEDDPAAAVIHLHIAQRFAGSVELDVGVAIFDADVAGDILKVDLLGAGDDLKLKPLPTRLTVMPP